MLGFHSAQRYFVCTAPVDMRKGIDGLCGVVRHILEDNPMSGYVFIFFNKDRDKIKLLARDLGGYVMYHKRLERGTFEVISGWEGKVKLSLRYDHLVMLLSDNAALQMALDGRRNESPFVLVHHSDRGIQYCSSGYIELLTSADIAISMTQSGSPYENALAERVNGILKGEFFPKRIYQNHREAKKALSKIIWTYNEQRPHASLDYLTPSQAEKENGELRRRWKRYSKVKEKEQLVGAI